MYIWPARNDTWPSKNEFGWSSWLDTIRKLFRALSWLANSIGRVLHRYRRGQVFKSCTSLNLFSGFLWQLQKLHPITAMIYFHIILHPTVYIYDFHTFLTSINFSLIKPETILIMYLENLSSSFNWSFNICVRT